jgi:trimeric autotransporter adhesin
MKTRQVLSMLVFLISMTTVMGQVPNGFNYQAVARDAEGVALTNSDIEITFAIRSASESGEVVWEEGHNRTTDATASISVVIGGTPGARTGGTAADFSDIDWSANTHFLQVTVDGTDMGTAQLMSVPYAALAQNVVNGGEGTWSTIDGNLFLPVGNVAVGSSTASSKFTIQGDPTAHVDTALFEVKNIDGDPVFAVYNEGVRIYIEDTDVKGVKGGFAVGGYNAKDKGLTNEFMRVTPDSVRIWVNESSKKGVKGGFAVGGYNALGKTTPTSFMQLDPENYFIGHEAGLNNDNGMFNSFFGYQAGHENTDGNQNIFVGYTSGYENTTGSLNTFIGNRTGFSNTTGFANVFIGDSSGYFNETGRWNVFVGEGTGINNTTGLANVFIGDKAGRKNEIGKKNVFLGSIAGWKNISGEDNVFIGSASGASNISGVANNFIGKSAGFNNETGNANIFLGTRAGNKNTTGSDNIYIGDAAGYNNDTTYSNIFIGNGSGEKNTGGFGNVFLGNRSGNENIDGSNNTILGHESGHFKTTGTGNTLLGAYAGFQNNEGNDNVFVGSSAGERSSNGHENTYIGSGAGFNGKGNQNVFIGKGAGYNEQGSGKLYIENSGADSSWALIYGDFYNDILTFNAKVGINTNNPWHDLHVSSYNTSAKLLVGQRDSIVGYGEFAGSRSGSPAGGSVRLATAADFDDTHEFWQMSVWGEDFQIGNAANFNTFVITKDGAIEHRGALLYADYVFEDNYQLESIEDHADFMWSNSHLPAVPKASLDENGLEVVDLGARNKGVLEELEKAHIYIEQLNDALKTQKVMIAELRVEIDALKTVK